VELLLYYGNEHVGGHGAPDLRFHRVFARAQEALDAHMLLDPFKEQLHLPMAHVKCGDDQQRLVAAFGLMLQARVVGQKHQRLARLRVFATDTPQMALSRPPAACPQRCVTPQGHLNPKESQMRNPKFQLWTPVNPSNPALLLACQHFSRN
jgi:hypothetical protein